MAPEDLNQSNQLRSHAMRVMGTVDKCLSCIHEPERVYRILHDLGARHVMYTAKVDYMDVRVMLMYILCPCLVNLCLVLKVSLPCQYKWSLGKPQNASSHNVDVRNNRPRLSAIASMNTYGECLQVALCKQNWFVVNALHYHATVAVISRLSVADIYLCTLSPITKYKPTK